MKDIDCFEALDALGPLELSQCMQFIETADCPLLIKESSSFPSDHHGGRQTGEEDRPASTGQEAQSENKDRGAANRQQPALAASQRHTQSVCGE